MNRKDLRTAESEWRGMSSAHRKHTKPLPKKRWSLKLTTVLKWLAVLILLMILWDQAQHCESILGGSIYCVD